MFGVVDRCTYPANLHHIDNVYQHSTLYQPNIDRHFLSHSLNTDLRLSVYVDHNILERFAIHLCLLLHYIDNLYYTLSYGGIVLFSLYNCLANHHHIDNVYRRSMLYRPSIYKHYHSHSLNIDLPRSEYAFHNILVQYLSRLYYLLHCIDIQSYTLAFEG